MRERSKKVTILRAQYALALPVGALAYLVIGWIPVVLGIKPIVVGAAFWTAAAIAILRQIAIQRQKNEVTVAA